MLQVVCSYVFQPIAALIGVDFEDLQVVAEVLGIKAIIMCFVSYIKLTDLIKLKKISVSSSSSYGIYLHVFHNNSTSRYH